MGIFLTGPSLYSVRDREEVFAFNLRGDSTISTSLDACFALALATIWRLFLIVDVLDFSETFLCEDTTLFAAGGKILFPDEEETPTKTGAKAGPGGKLR